MAAVAVLSALGPQTPAPFSRVVVVVDGDAPAADPVAAARLRDEVLRHLDGAVPASYYELNADGLTAVPDATAVAFRRSRFTVTPPTYSGVSISFAESVEVLRGNEFVRDTVIGRECPPPAGECAGHVRAAADAEVRRGERSSARKLQSLAAAAGEWRGGRVVVFTAGWPTRDEGRVALDAAVRALRGHGLSLVVVRVPPRDAYRGLVRDASESLAAQLPAGFLTLGDDADIAAVASAVDAGVLLAHGVRSDPAAPVATGGATSTSPPAGLPPAVAPPSTTDASAPDGVALATAEADPRASGADASANDVAPPLPDPLLRRAAAYVDRFESTFTSVLWHERYEQEERMSRRFNSSGATTSEVVERRLLEAELFFAWLPQDATWITVRDVVSVDGQVRPQGERRLPSLAARSTVSLPELRELARLNGRFNLGQIVRTFNEPTLALLFLDARHRAGVRFTRKANRQAGGRLLAVYDFAERGRQTVIRSGTRSLPVRGSFAVDQATGAVWSTTIEMSEPAGGLTGRMTVDYQAHVAFDVLVPREMRESYTSPTQEITATAIYSDFRRFRTSGRLILTP